MYEIFFFFFLNTRNSSTGKLEKWHHKISVSFFIIYTNSLKELQQFSDFFLDCFYIFSPQKSTCKQKKKNARYGIEEDIEMSVEERAMIS